MTDVIKGRFQFLQNLCKKSKYIGVKSCSRHKMKTWHNIFVTTSLDPRTVIINNLKLLYPGWPIPMEYESNTRQMVCCAGAAC